MFTKEFLKNLAKSEKVETKFLEKQFKQGKVVIPLNNTKKIKKPCAIGEGLKIKINTNIGSSPENTNYNEEISKLKVAIEYGTDTIMDLSIGPNSNEIRKKIINASTVPIGTVPIYETAQEVQRRKGTFEKMTFEDIWDTLIKQAEEGVDFFTIHAGILQESLELLKQQKRVGGIVSRGGAITTRWMLINKKENPFYTNFDKILALAKKYNITLSLGDALRPGAVADSSDILQLGELYTLGKLVRKCRKENVQVMIEGPGHIKLDEIAMNMQVEKKLCDNAPFYVLGPLPTDIAAGYDHITSSIGGAIAALNGANFLCVVTPAEHLRHPSIEDIKEGVIASRIAAHSVDLLKFKDEWERDYQLSLHRSGREWDKIFPLTLDKKKAKAYRQYSKTSSKNICSMCGNFCALKIVEKCDLLK